ncbi:PIN-like domain-containing protein [Pseudomonas sp. MAC6]|uniref:PIN-like domain-containing protein n=1 Tax=Pseudomonas sp. MAC6 TaxID=3401633 RepID=UPI003BF55B7B
MSYDHHLPRAASNARSTRLKPKQVVASLSVEKHRLLNAVLHSDCPIFLDTNILLWSFELNEAASDVWQKWLHSLEERLVIPAWVVHEYNQFSHMPETLTPYKSLTKRLQVALDEVRDSAVRALDGSAAASLNCSSKIDLERKLAEASDFILKVARSVSRNDGGHRMELLKFYEQLLTERCLSSDLHVLSQQADEEFTVRSALRLSPGWRDANKPHNSCGDLIIWKEVLQYCAQTGKGEAIFISRDVKDDWCYKPAKVVLENGKEVFWSSEATPNLLLPKPELLAEFLQHTGEEGILFATVKQVIAALSSADHNALEAAAFGHLAQAAQSNRTPTDRVIDLILDSDQLYQEGLKGVAYWQWSPDEVDADKFEAWCREKLKDARIPFEKVDWGNVFVALYL